MIPNPAPLGGDNDENGAQRECQALTSTLQIGCLVGRDARWGKRSFGYAGLGSALVWSKNPVPGNRLKVDGVEAPAEGGLPVSCERSQ